MKTSKIVCDCCNEEITEDSSSSYGRVSISIWGNPFNFKQGMEGVEIHSSEINWEQVCSECTKRISEKIYSCIKEQRIIE